MKPGIYRVYSLKHGAQVQRSYIGRVVVSNGHTHVVEDRNELLSETVGDGAIDAQKEARWKRMASSPYFDVVSEADLAPQQIEQPAIPPDETFDVVDDTLGTRRRLEAYGDDFFLDGKHLEAQQSEQLMNEVRLGHIHLIPVVHQ